MMDIYAQLRRDENLSLRLYPDAAGFSIGYGRDLTTKGISREEAELFLQHDVADCLSDCSALSVWSKLSEARRGVLLNMCYELGFHGLTGFHEMFVALEAGDCDKAAEAMLDSKWAKEQSPARAYRLAQQMRLDAWQ